MKAWVSRKALLTLWNAVKSSRTRGVRLIGSDRLVAESTDLNIYISTPLAGPVVEPGEIMLPPSFFKPLKLIKTSQFLIEANGRAIFLIAGSDHYRFPAIEDTLPEYPLHSATKACWASSGHLLKAIKRAKGLLGKGPLENLLFSVDSCTLNIVASNGIAIIISKLSCPSEIEAQWPTVAAPQNFEALSLIPADTSLIVNGNDEFLFMQAGNFRLAARLGVRDYPNWRQYATAPPPSFGILAGTLREMINATLDARYARLDVGPSGLLVSAGEGQEATLSHCPVGYHGEPIGASLHKPTLAAFLRNLPRDIFVWVSINGDRPAYFTTHDGTLFAIMPSRE